MKNRILTIIVILTYLTLPESSFGQQNPSDYGRVTPQTADFMRYGDIVITKITSRIYLCSTSPDIPDDL